MAKDGTLVAAGGRPKATSVVGRHLSGLPGFVASTTEGGTALCLRRVGAYYLDGMAVPRSRRPSPRPLVRGPAGGSALRPSSRV